MASPEIRTQEPRHLGLSFTPGLGPQSSPPIWQLATLLVVGSVVVWAVATASSSASLGFLCAVSGWFAWGNLARLEAIRLGRSLSRRPRQKPTVKDIVIAVPFGIAAFVACRLAMAVSDGMFAVTAFAGWVLLVDIPLRVRRHREA